MRSTVNSTTQAMNIYRSLRYALHGLVVSGRGIHPAGDDEIDLKSKILAALLFVACSTAAGQSSDCKVIDPELQSAYSGPCVNGLAQGEGRASGIAVYEGGFKAGAKHGRGVKRWPNGDRYEGEFVEDRKEGHGTYAWGRGEWHGERYEGEYANDRRHGEGAYFWPTGDVYRGPWKDDRIAGYATPMMLAQRRFAEESMKAVGRKGQTVCRELPMGIAATQWIRGEVVGVSEGRVGVRVSEPGHRPVVAGVELQANDIVWDAPTQWVPCW